MKRALAILALVGALAACSKPPEPPAPTPTTETALDRLRTSWGFADPQDRRIVCEGWHQDPEETLDIFERVHKGYTRDTGRALFREVC